MKLFELLSSCASSAGVSMSRRRMLLGGTAVAAAATAACGSPLPGLLSAASVPASDNVSQDTPVQIFTAALIAEDLATTFYYNGLVGPVIQDPNLAGSGGTAASPASSNSNVPNVGYLRGALSEEIAHANLMRSLSGGSAASGDPVQTFYLPTGCFNTLSAFLGVLNALENAFIGAYLNAVQEFAQMAADVKSGAQAYKDSTGKAYSNVQLEYFAKVASSILGVEAEHRALGRAINPSASAIPANNLNYQQDDGLSSVYNGSASAVAALTPFLNPGSGLTGYSLATALSGAASVSLATTGNPPN